MLYPRIHIARLQKPISGLVFVLAVTALQPASAQPTIQQCANGATRTPTKEIVIPGKHGSFDVDVHRDVLATVEMPDEISGVTFPRHVAKRFWFEVAEDRSAIEFKPINFPVGHVTTLNLKSDKADMAVTARIRVVSKATQIDHSLYRVRKKSMAQACLDMIASQIDQEVEKVEQRYQHDLTKLQEEREQERAAYEREKREQANEVARNVRVTMARHVLDHVQRRPRSISLEMSHLLSNRRVAVRVFEPEWHGDEFLIPFELKNQTGAPLTITEVQAAGENGKRLAGDVLALHGVDTESLPVTIPNNLALRGVFGLPSVTSDAVTPLRLSFIAAGVKPVVVVAARWYPADLERIRKEERMSRTSVSVGPAGGVMWLEDGANQGLLEPVGFGGLAVRIQKGYYWGGALEATIMGGRTGQAHFDEVTWDTTQGTVTRSATVGRVLGGIAMRFGHRYTFVGRTGLGLQGGINDARFITGTNSDADGPGDGFALDMLLYVGAGLDVHLGKHWTIGAIIDGSAALKNIGGAGASGFLETDIYLRYGWGE